jgi:subtilisin family serine protease
MTAGLPDSIRSPGPQAVDVAVAVAEVASKSDSSSVLFLDKTGHRMKLSNLTLKPAVSLIAAIGMLASSAALAANNGSQQDYAPGRILLEARDGVSNADLDKIVNVPGHKRRKLGQGKIQLVQLPANASETALVQRLSHNPHIRFAELDRRVKSTLAVSDPYAGSEWHLDKVGAGSAWDTTQGAGVTIAILDSGVDTSHPDLAPNLVAGYNAYDSNNDVTDVCGHGTAVAGTAAAASNNGVGVAGVAGQAKIMPVRVAYLNSADNGCYTYYSTVASGLTYAADHGARIANVSYGGVSASAAVISSANYMKSKGGLVFISAGNTGTDQGFAPTSAMVVVSATDANDLVAGWSSFGSFVALSAPGANIWTTSRGGIYQGWNGTSFSSPLTAGVAALLMSAAPSLSGAQVENLLYSTAVDLGAAGRDPYFGFGRVDAAAGVRAALSYTPPVDSVAPTAAITAPLGSSSVSGLVAVDVSAKDDVGVVRAELQVNGSTVASETAAPFGFSWDSAGVPNGMANLVVVAFDAAGNRGQSAPVAVNVANTQAPIGVDTQAPSVAINNPVAGAVTGNVAVSVSASDNSGAAGISQQLLIDGVQVARSTGAALSYNWNTRKAKAGTHTVQAIARDAAGNSSSTSVSVTTR